MTTYTTKTWGLLSLIQAHRQKSSVLLYHNMQTVGDLTTRVPVAEVVCQNTRFSASP